MTHPIDIQNAIALLHSQGYRVDKKEGFEWNDELVKEFVSRDPSIHRCEQDMEEFKQSKVQVPLQVSHFSEHDNLKGNKLDSFFYQFCCSHKISQERLKDIPNLIERFLNGELDNPAPQANCNQYIFGY